MKGPCRYLTPGLTPPCQPDLNETWVVDKVRRLGGHRPSGSHSGKEDGHWDM